MTTHATFSYGPCSGRYIDNDTHPLDWAKCGTPANHQAHLRRGQEPCGPCKKANRLRESLRPKRTR